MNSTHYIYIHIYTSCDSYIRKIFHFPQLFIPPFTSIHIEPQSVCSDSDGTWVCHSPKKQQWPDEWGQLRVPQPCRAIQVLWDKAMPLENLSHSVSSLDLYKVSYFYTTSYISSNTIKLPYWSYFSSIDNYHFISFCLFTWFVSL